MRCDVEKGLVKSGVVGLGVGQHLPPVDEETCPVELRRDAAGLGVQVGRPQVVMLP